MKSGGLSINKRRLFEILFFLAVMALSFYTVFHGQDIGQILRELRKLSAFSVCAAIVTALFFVSAEGLMIFYLLRALGGKSGLLRCISYSFIGFFYSGITPSATGGQPMQLYYLKKDGNSLADSSVVLMVVALIYKFVLVVWGILMLLFWRGPLKSYLGSYFGLYLLGLALNAGLVAILSGVMLWPEGMKGIIRGVENLLVFLHLLKPSEKRKENVLRFVDGYQNAIGFLIDHKRKVCFVVAFTCLQRASVFILTYIIYRGFRLQGTDLFAVMFLQASVYIAVDMLPVPGAQGITELMYRSVFLSVFTERYLMPSLYVTRGISFYFLLLVSLVVIGGNWVCRNSPVFRRKKSEEQTQKTWK